MPSRIDWRETDVRVPPVRGREHLPAGERLIDYGRRRREHRDSSSERESKRKTDLHEDGPYTSRAGPSAGHGSG